MSRNENRSWLATLLTVRMRQSNADGSKKELFIEVSIVLAGIAWAVYLIT